MDLGRNGRGNEVSSFHPSYLVGDRDGLTAKMFVDDLSSWLAHRFQLTTAGLEAYLEAVQGAFGCDVDFAMLVKLYGSTQEDVRYGPAECIGTERKVVSGKPTPEQISTSYVERQNLSMRMGML